MAEGRPPVGGLIVLTGYASERLGYLAALLSENLAEALWAPSPELKGGEREVRVALRHLLAGTTVVQLAEASQLGLFRNLAERSGARFLHVLSPPPSGPEATSEQPPEPEATSEQPPEPEATSEQPPEPEATQEGRPKYTLIPASASLTTQLDVVMAAWIRPKERPPGRGQAQDERERTPSSRSEQVGRGTQPAAKAAKCGIPRRRPGE